MRQLIKPSLERALSGIEVTDSMKNSVMQKLAGQHAEIPTKRHARFSVALVAAIVLALAMSALAVANRESLLKRWYYQAPSDANQQLMRDEHQSYEQDGIRVSIVESLIDANSVAVTWEVESLLDEPVLVDVERFPTIYLTDGTRVAIYDRGMILLGGEIGGKPQPKSFTTVREYANPVGQSAEADIQIAAFRPLMPMLPEAESRPVGSDGYMPLHPSDGNLYFSKTGLTEPWDYDSVRKNFAENRSVNELFEKAGYVAPLASIDHSFPIADNPNAAQSGTHIVGPNRFDFDRYTLVVRELNFGATQTTFRMDLYPNYAFAKTSSGRNGEAENDPIWRQYRLLDAEGKDLLEGVSGGYSCNWDRERNCLAYYYSAGPVERAPESVTLTPINNFNWESGIGREERLRLTREHLDPTEAVTIPLAPGLAATAVPSGGTHIVGQTQFEFDEYTMRVTGLNFTPNQTVLSMVMVPKVTLTVADMAWDHMSPANPPYSNQYRLIGTDGQDLMADTPMEARKLAWNEEEGHILIEQYYDPSASAPDEVTIVPILPFEWNSTGLDDLRRMERESVDMTHAMTIQLAPGPSIE